MSKLKLLRTILRLQGLKITHFRPSFIATRSSTSRSSRTRTAAAARIVGGAYGSCAR